ncbi:unnamed protein product [Meloidogyne enterolobii]|uniref:Uncharacterized protein n=1 Tax=Meloidogyne enterolobii TaxID=390850 RepID=A0ACB1AS60_MELEN
MIIKFIIKFKLLASHMFYLAFENSVCKNYITEKFWYLKHLIVPIVLSRRVFKKTKIPDNVYIAVDDFNNVEELAEHLLYLQKNRTAYMKYVYVFLDIFSRYFSYESINVELIRDFRGDTRQHKCQKGQKTNT